MNPLDFLMGAEELGLDESASNIAAEVGDVVEATIKAEVSEATAAIEEQTGEIAKLVDKVDELEEAVEEVEECVEGLESLLSSGNFNSVSAANTYNRMVKLGEKLGCEFTGGRVGAESMSDAATANMHIRSGIEAIGETLKNWASGAVNFIKHIFNVIVGFFTSLFNKLDGLAKQEANLRKRVNDGAKLKDKVKLGSWNAYVDYASSGLTGKGVKTKGSTDGLRAGIGELVAEAGKVDGITAAGVKTAYSSLVAGIKTDARAFGKYNEKKQGSKDVALSQFAGIRYVASFADPSITTLAEAASAIRSVSVAIGKAPEAKKLTSGAEVKSKADKSGLIGALDEAKAGIAHARDSKLSKQLTNTTRDQIVGKLNNLAAGDADKKSDVASKVAVVKATYALAAKLSSNTDRMTLNAIGASLDAVSAHIGFGAA